MSAARFSDYSELVFHIGFHKTGTSYLQALCRANAPLLDSAGIHYPAYRSAPRAAQADGNHSSAVKKSLPGRPLAGELDEHVELASSCPTLLLSAEQFCQAAGIAALAKDAELRARDKPPRFVVYFRRYDELTESVWSQVVKDWAVGPIQPHYYRANEGLFRRVEGLISAYGKEALTIRPYNPGLWVEGRLAADFFTALGRPDVWPLMTDRRDATKNVALSRSHSWLLSQVEDRRLKKILVAHFADHPLPVPPEPSRFFLSPAERRALNRTGLAADRKLFAAMGITDPVAFLDLETFTDDESWTPFVPDRALLDPYLAEFLAIPRPKKQPPVRAKPPVKRKAKPKTVRIAKAPPPKLSFLDRIKLKIFNIGGKQ